MAISEYVNTTEYTGDAVLAETFYQGQSTRNILSALGDYWTEYFNDYDLLKAVVSGATTLYSTEYYKVLNMVLSSNVSYIPIEEPTRFGIKVFSIKDRVTHLGDDGDVAAYSFPLEDERHIKYLVSSLFDPTVVLQEDIHYTLDENRIYFVVDIFEDININRGIYTIESGEDRYILFWSIDILFDSTTIYERFGTYLYDYSINSVQYKSLVMALQFFYTQAKTVKNIKTIVNVLYGIPYSRYTNETIVSIENLYNTSGNLSGTKVTTDQTTYTIPPFCTLLVSEGDVVDKFTLLAYWHEVEDYKTSPDWYEGARLPTTITAITHPDFDENARAHKDGGDWEKYLYNLYDTTLKHNLVLLRTKLNFDNYQFFKGGARNLYKIIRSGFPVYLYPVIEAIFYIDEYETVPSNIDSRPLIKAKLRFSETTEVRTADDFDYHVLMPPLIESIRPDIKETVEDHTIVPADDSVTSTANCNDDLTVNVTIRPVDLPTICTMGMLVNDLTKPAINLPNWTAKRLFLSHTLADVVDIPTTTTTAMYLQNLFAQNIYAHKVVLPTTYTTAMFTAAIISRNEI